MPRAATHRWLQPTLRIAFAALLLATGIAKLLDVRGFAAVVDSYAVLPAALVPPSAWALALAEVALGLWLLSNRRMRPATALLVTLHAIYLLWLLDALRRGMTLANCGCFGVYWPRPLTWMTPLEDLALLVLAVALRWLVRRNGESR